MTKYVNSINKWLYSCLLKSKNWHIFQVILIKVFLMKLTQKNATSIKKSEDIFMSSISKATLIKKGKLIKLFNLSFDQFIYAGLLSIKISDGFPV